MKIWKLIVDTEQYAGNFEREMCAFVTGQIGECSVGQELAESYQKEPNNYDFSKKIMKVPCERGVRRPVEITATPGWFNSSGKHYQMNENHELLALKEGITTQINKTLDFMRIKMEMLKTKQFKHNWSEQEVLWDVEYSLEKIRSSANKVQADKWPAFLSVAIFFSEQPNEDELDFLKNRILRFGLMRELTISNINLQESEFEPNFQDCTIMGWA